MMPAQDKIKLAVIGVGNMGRPHAKDVASLAQTELAAVCDLDQARLAPVADEYGLKAFTDYREMFDQVTLDAVLIATPHYDHTPISIEAMQRGIHVLVEKPIAVHVKDARKMIAAYQAAREKYRNLVFAAMFMQRTYGHYQKIKALIDEGALGRLVRITWLITDWFRTQSYYDSGGWRATWAGEGGGVLLNQCPHNLDLYQWFVGMPRRVTGFAAIGKYHHIEVEDEVTAYLEYDNGLVGHFITTTAESPGTNRLEIVGENGKLIFEDNKLLFYENQHSMFKQIAEAPGGFDKVTYNAHEVAFDHHGQPGHKFIIENFANAILTGEKLIAPAAEGLNSVMLGNAMMLSSFLRQTVELPLDEDAYAAKLQELVKTSKFQKVTREQLADISQSFGGQA